MKKITYPYIRKGKYLTNFEVVLEEGRVVECYNLATARSVYYEHVKKLQDSNQKE